MVTINSLFKKYKQLAGRIFNKQQDNTKGIPKPKRDTYVFYAGKLTGKLEAYQEILNDLYELDKIQGRNQVIDGVINR
jgi:hypothetical protein